MTTRLKEAREKAGYTIEQVSSALKIRKQYVMDLEEENRVNVLSKTYIDGYKKIYYEFLNLEFKDEQVVLNTASPLESENIRIIKQKIVIIASLIMLIVVLGVYSL